MAVKYSGANGLIYMSSTGTGAPALAGGFRAFTLDNSRNFIDTTEFGASNATAVQGFPASSGTFEGFWATDDTVMRDASKRTGRDSSVAGSRISSAAIGSVARLPYSVTPSTRATGANAGRRSYDVTTHPIARLASSGRVGASSN